MNICILTFDYPPHPVYGSGVYVDFLTKALRESNHTVKIITVNRFGLIQDNDAVFCQCTHKEEAIEKGKCVCTFGNMGCFQGLLEKTVARFQEENFVPDVIYVNGYMFFDIAQKLSLIYKNAKLISAIHFLVEQNDVPENNLERKKIYDEETRMIVNSHEIIYFGDLAYELIKKRNICDLNKLHLIQHACNVEVYLRKFKKNRRFVYASRLEPGKGIEFLCEALTSINEEFTLDIIGTGRLYRIINEKYGNAFQVHGYKNKAFVLEKLKNADFFILPSFSEHCPLIVLEGMACGSIPILSNFGNLPKLVKEHSSGIVFDIETEKDIFIANISNAIRFALELDEKKANDMIHTNYDLLQKHFAPEVMLKDTLDVFC